MELISKYLSSFFDPSKNVFLGAKRKMCRNRRWKVCWSFLWYHHHLRESENGSTFSDYQFRALFCSSILSRLYFDGVQQVCVCVWRTKWSTWIVIETSNKLFLFPVRVKSSFSHRIATQDSFRFFWRGSCVMCGQILGWIELVCKTARWLRLHYTFSLLAK